METDLYIKILEIVEGDVEKATKIRKLIDSTIVDEFTNLLVEYQRGCVK